MTSPKWTLIWADIKSWLLTSLLFLAPVAIEQLIQLLAKYNWGAWGVAIAFILGSLLKLAQKWQQANYYQSNS